MPLRSNSTPAPNTLAQTCQLCLRFIPIFSKGMGTIIKLRIVMFALCFLPLSAPQYHTRTFLNTESPPLISIPYLNLYKGISIRICC